MKKKMAPIIALLLVVAIAAPLLSSTPALAADTGWTNATNNTAQDGDGFEVNPTYAYLNGAPGAAANLNGSDHSHRYWGYDFSGIPAGSDIDGIAVRLDWWLNSATAYNYIGVRLSWDGGYNWTSEKLYTGEPTSDPEGTVIIGGAADDWGHGWMLSELSNANFRVLVRCHSEATPAREFYFDWIAVNVTYTTHEMCNLTVNSNGCCPITVGTMGSVNANESDTFEVVCGTNVTLVADDSDPCCVFDYWSGDASGTNPTVQVTMDGNKTVTGTCHWLTYNLTVESDGCCPITVEFDSTYEGVEAGESETFEDIPCGTNVTLTANNSTCCQFDSWNVTGQFPVFGKIAVDGGENIIEVTMDSNYTAVAYCNLICGSIGNTIFYDNNNSGTQDPGEGGIQGVTVQLYKDDGNGVFNIEATDELIDETTTDQDGKYEFPDLPPFCDQGYWVLVVESTLPAGVTLTTGFNPIGPICVAEGQSYDTADFGYLGPTPPVGGEAYPINKLAILAPWIALAAAVAVGIAILARRRRAQS